MIHFYFFHNLFYCVIRYAKYSLFISDRMAEIIKEELKLEDFEINEELISTSKKSFPPLL